MQELRPAGGGQSSVVATAAPLGAYSASQVSTKDEGALIGMVAACPAVPGNVEKWAGPPGLSMDGQSASVSVPFTVEPGVIWVPKHPTVVEASPGGRSSPMPKIKGSESIRGAPRCSTIVPPTCASPG